MTAPLLRLRYPALNKESTRNRVSQMTQRGGEELRALPRVGRIPESFGDFAGSSAHSRTPQRKSLFSRKEQNRKIILINKSVLI
jgi:hypothetical protein